MSLRSFQQQINMESLSDLDENIVSIDSQRGMSQFNKLFKDKLPTKNKNLKARYGNFSEQDKVQIESQMNSQSDVTHSVDE